MDHQLDETERINLFNYLVKNDFITEHSPGSISKNTLLSKYWECKNNENRVILIAVIIMFILGQILLYKRLILKLYFVFIFLKSVYFK